MGLDVTAYRKLTPVKHLAKPSDDTMRILRHPAFPGRCDDLQDRGLYRYENDTLDFGCGGYGRYGIWRDRLAKLAGYPKVHGSEYGHDYSAGAWNAEEGPFWELINFADNEGTLGTATCTKLAKDFADFQEKADALGDEEFSHFYAKWREAFEFASDGGCVDLH